MATAAVSSRGARGSRIGQARAYWHSAPLKKFFTNRTHRKFCPSCGKPGALLLEECNACGTALGDEHIRPIGRDPLLEAVVGSSMKAGGFQELHRSFETLVVQHQFPTGRVHVLATPKGTIYDLRQLRRKHLPLLQALRAQGMVCLRSQLGLPEDGPEPAAMVGFSYPSDFNQLHLHLVVPPFGSMALFARHVFYSYGEVEAELERRNIVRPHAVSLGNTGEEDRPLQHAEAMDQAARAATAAGAGDDVVIARRR